ncbi:MAG: hypothetical protein NTZ35_08140 [Ignavibacteriales bacterium]|nr:hypothetical protein [Ignavibacteriales bacterium]
MSIPLYCKIHYVSFLIPTVTGFTRFSSLTKAMRILTVLCFFSCFDVVTQYLVSLWLGNNLFLSHFYIVLELGMICAVFYFSIMPQRTRNTLLTIGGMFVVFWAADLIFYFNPKEINTLTQMVQRMLLIVMSMITLQALMRDETSSLVERPVFWVAISVVLYATATLMAVGLGNQLLALGQTYFDVAWNINWTFIIITNLLYTKALMCKLER